MLNGSVLETLLSAASQEVNVRFCVDCALRVEDLLRPETVAVVLGRRILTSCEQWLENQNEEVEFCCARDCDTLAVILGRWANDVQSMHNTAVDFALEACVRAGGCVGESSIDLSAAVGASRAVSARSVVAPVLERAAAKNSEQLWQLRRLTELMWPGLGDVEVELAVMVTLETACTGGEAGEVTLALCAPVGVRGSARGETVLGSRQNGLVD
jgi:hypothetical protein